jgi:hypothetical protein
MKPLVALLVSLSLAACFPNSAKHRTYAKLGEGAALAGGIAMLAVVNSGADCDNMRSIGDHNDGCRGNADVLGTVGLGLIVAGMVGFIATVSTSPEDKPETPVNTLTKTPIPASEDGTSPKSPTVTPAAPALK